jgi:hypothetical protein
MRARLAALAVLALAPGARADDRPNPFGLAFAAEGRTLAGDWASLREAVDLERLHFGQQFLADLFTGDGLHPTVGAIAPGSTLGVGAALNVLDADPDRRFRALYNLEGRVAPGDLSFAAGGRATLYLQSSTPGRKPPRFVFSVTDTSLAARDFYGVGNDTPASGRAVFGLQDAEATASAVLVIPHDSKIGLHLGGERVALRRGRSEGVPSIETRYDESTAPGLDARVYYVIPSIDLCPGCAAEEQLHGFRAWADLAYAPYLAASGGAYGFHRVEALASLMESPGDDGAWGTFSLVARAVVCRPFDHDRVPVAKLPTLGGSALGAWNDLRSQPNFRFAAPAVWSARLEYEHEFLEPVGLLVFGDVGSVADGPGGWLDGGMKHGVGTGATLRLGGQTVAAVTVAWGGDGVRVGALGDTNAALPTGNQSGIVGADMSGVF